MDKTAVLIPCYNEELTIGKVIDDFKKSLPDAVIYVYDNNSKDMTAEIAKEHGYSFTEDEYNDLKMEAVSGGIDKADLMGLLKMGADKLGDYAKSEDGQKTVGGLFGKAGDFFKKFGSK